MKGNKSSTNTYFTVELFAMAFALLCTLSFLCLVSGDLLFGDIGLMVQRFFLGVFGYLAFPAVIGGAYLGVKGVVGFKLKDGAIKALVTYLLLYAFFIVTIIQTASTDLSVGSFKAYASACYDAGLSFATTTAGGVIFALVVYPLGTLMTSVGVYIFCSVALAFLSVILFRTPIGALLKRMKEGGEKTPRAPREKGKKSNKPEKTSEKGREVTAGDAASSEKPTSEPGDLEETSGGDGFGIPGEFALKSEKDKKNKEKEYSLKLLFGDDGSADGGSSRKSYGASYDEEFAAKTEYIRRPYEMRGMKVESPMGGSRSVSFSDPDDGLGVDVSSPDSDVYVIRNEGGRTSSRIKSFDDASGRYDSVGPASGESSEENEYNRDRFTRPERTVGRNIFDDDRSGDRADTGSARGRMRGDLSYPDADGSFSARSSEYGGAAERRSGYDGASERSERRYDVSGAVPDEDEEAMRRSAYAAGRARASRNARDFDDFADDEGNTPNAEVLRRLSKAEREKKNASKTFGNRTGTEGDRADYSGRIESVRGYRSDEPIGGGDGYGEEPDRTERTSRMRTETGSRDFSDESYSGDTYSTDAHTDRATDTRTSSMRSDCGRDFGGYAEEPGKADGPTATATEEKTDGAPRAAKTGMQTAMYEQEEKENPIDNIPKSYKFRFPPVNLLKDYAPDPAVQAKIKREQSNRRDVIVDTINNPDIGADIADIRVGPSITRFEITIPPRVPMRKVTEKYDDINLWVAAKSKIRIVAPIPGTSRIGLEVPNSELTTVGVKEVMNSDEFKNAKKSSITFTLGKDMVGKSLVADIAKMPHLLVAGATGTGKSVFLNTMLVSLMYKYSPDELRMVLVDPKLVEFSVYKSIPELLFGEIFTEPQETCAMLDWMVEEMGRRYHAFQEAMVRDIDEYNAYVSATKGKKMFRILILIDEFADLMAQQNDKKRMDTAIGRLAAKARSAGIHIILATQRPTTDIVDGSIKTNFPSRIVFKMSSPTDAMVVMGEAGAEKLLGDGDMFYKVGKMSTIERAQGAFITAKEVNDVCTFVKENNKTFYDERALEAIRKIGEENEAAAASGDYEGGGDESSAAKGSSVEESLLKAAMRIAIHGGNVSISLLQRKLGVGYPKAGKIVDTLEAKGYISGQAENNKRKILMTAEQFEQTFGEPL